MRSVTNGKEFDYRGTKERSSLWRRSSLPASRMRLASYMDSKQSKKAANVIIKKGKALGLLLYAVGVVYFYYLTSDEMSRKGYFDENALMTGMVRREFSHQRSISKHAEEIKQLGDDSLSTLSWLEAKFAVMGLEVYSQNFSANVPVSYTSQDSSVTGRNVYGILRAGRSLGTESIILSVPLLEERGRNRHGIAVMLALVEHFQTKNYWAKDLIFLVTSHDEVGMQAWINGYMGTHSTGIHGGPLPGRSGAIQAVINLEILSANLHHVDIIAEGVNGILPNLDLVNVVSYLCQSEGIPVFFHTTDPSPLLTLLAVVAHQAPGLPLSNHALFLTHRIDSVTVRGVSGGRASNLHNLGRALEGTFRSINNLLETLHHSEFFYFTISNWRFVSIGQFMPLVGFLIAPVVLESVYALSQWLMARNPSLLHSNTGSDTQESDEKAPNPTEQVVTVPFPFQSLMKLLLVSMTSGLLLYASPGIASALLPHPLKADEMYLSLLVTMVTSIVIPLLVRSLIGDGEWRMVKSISLILFMLALLAVAMTNYSLSLYLSLALTLPAVLAQPWISAPGTRRIHHLLRCLTTLLLSPPLCLVYFALAFIILFPPTALSTSHSELLAQAGKLVLHGVAWSYNSWFFVGSWLYPFVCVVVWPLWLMYWTLSCQVARQQDDPAPSKLEPHPHSD